MKIHGQNESIAKISKIKTPKRAFKASSAKGAMPMKSVELSNLAMELSNLHEEVMKTPEIRMEKVSAIKNKIEAGNYKVDEDKLAEELSKYFG